MSDGNKERLGSDLEANDARVNWEFMFEGRTAEVERLKTKWRLAATGLSQFEVLVGPRGVGKTRLVQEIYRWLSVEHDPNQDLAPEGYWPDTILDTSDTTDVHPKIPAGFHTGAAELPWLWWGVRVSSEAVSHPPFLNADTQLFTHLQAIIAKRDLNSLSGKRLNKLKGVLTGATLSLLDLLLTAGTLGIASLLNSLRNALAGNKEERGKLEKIMGEGASLDAVISDRYALLFAMLELVLSEEITDAPTVPVVLVIDDAQYLFRKDPDQPPLPSLKFLRDLWETAQSRQWKLLIIATHWDDHWEKHKQVIRPEESPRSLAHLLRELGLPDEPGVVRRLEKLPRTTLEPVVKVALPGLTDSQLDTLLDRCDGNGRILELHIRRILKTPRWFENENTYAALTPNGHRAIREFKTELHGVVKDRLLAFTGDEGFVRDALGWSSVQGEHFLTSVTQAVAREIDPSLTDDDIERGLEIGEHPERIVRRTADTSRFLRGEFRQNVYREAALELLEEDDPDRLVAIRSGLRSVLVDWMLSPKIDGFEATPAEQAERRDLLLLGTHHLHPRLFDKGDKQTDVDRGRTAWAAAVARLVKADRAAYVFEASLPQAEEFAVIFQEECPLPVSPQNTWLQIAVVDLLVHWNRFDAARSLLENLQEQLTPTLQSAGENQLHDFMAVLQRLGDIQTKQEGIAAAWTTFQALLETARKLAQIKRSRTSLRDVSVSLNKVADAMRGLGIGSVSIDGEDRSALDLYVESLHERRTIVTEFGRSPEALRDVSVSLDRVADAMRGLGIGSVSIDGEDRSALDLYRESLHERRTIVTEFGRSPEALRDVSVSCERMADVHLQIAKDGDNSALQQTFEFLNESLQHWQAIQANYEVTPDSLRGPVVPLWGLSSLCAAVGQRDTAIQFAQQIVAIYAEIESRGWATPQFQKEADAANAWLRELTSSDEPDMPNHRNP